MNGEEETERILESSKEFEQKKSDKNRNRRWFSIILTWLNVFFTMSQFTMFSGILEPYLTLLNPSTSKDFASWTIMAFSIGQMVSAPLFGLWSNKTKKCKLPIVTGLAIVILGTSTFLCIELFPLSARRWAMLVIRIFIGFGSGILSVCRSYCATASLKSERSMAVVGSTAALGLAVVAGPGAQGLFALVDYPGIYIYSFHMHMYNAPAVASLIILLLLLILNATLLLEEYPGVVKRQNDDKNTVFNARALPKYDKFGAFVLQWGWFCAWTLLTIFVILGLPFTQAQFDWSLSEALLFNGGIFAAFAAVSLLFYTLYAIYGPRLDDRYALITGMSLMLSFWLLTLPWPGYPVPTSDPMFNYSELNVTTNLTTVCKFAPQSSTQSWCFHTPRIPVWLYMGSFALLAVGFTISNSALSSLLPKLVGPRRQGTMQGLTVTTGGVGRLFGPLVISLLFTRYGPQIPWAITIALITSGIVVTIIFRKRLVPLVAEPKLKHGEYYYYKLGIVYRF